jgi:hypothetical protein
VFLDRSSLEKYFLLLMRNLDLRRTDFEFLRKSFLLPALDNAVEKACLSSGLHMLEHAGSVLWATEVGAHVDLDVL